MAGRGDEQSARGTQKGSGASRPPAHARTAGPDRAALGMPPPPQLRLLVRGKGRPGSGAGAPTPSRLGQLLRVGEPRIEQPTPGSRDPGENPAALFRAGRDTRAYPGPRRQTRRCTRARERRGLPEQVATPGPRTTRQCSSRERNPPQDHLAHSPPGSPIHPHLLRGQRAPSAGPAPCPPRRHVADQVCAARIPAVGRERRGPAGARSPQPRLHAPASGPGGEGGAAEISLREGRAHTPGAVQEDSELPDRSAGPGTRGPESGSPAGLPEWGRGEWGLH